MTQGDFGQQSLETIALFDTATALALIVIDHEHAVLGPTQNYCVVRQSILPRSRFLMVEHLLWVGLTHVNDRQAIQVVILNLGRA